MHTTSRRAFFFPILLIIIGMLSIQSGASLAKSLFEQLTPFGVVSLRISLGAIILFFILRPWRQRYPIHKKSLCAIIGYGVTLAAMNSLFYLALSRIPLGVAVGLEFIGPLAVAILSSRKKVDFLWIILAAIGLYFLLPLHHNLSDVDPIGAIFALLAGCGWACYIIVGKQAGKYFGVQAASFGTIIASCIILPISLHLVGGSVLFSLSTLPFALAIAVLSNAIPFSFEMFALTKLPTKTFSILMSVEPAIAALCGVILLHEKLTAVEWAALFIIMIASVGATLTISPKKSEIKEITTENESQ